MIYKLQLRRDTESNWSFSNPVLSEAEVGVITDRTPVQLVIGDGSTPFMNLVRYYMPYVESSESLQGFVYIDSVEELSPEVNQLGWCYEGKLLTYVGDGGDIYGGKYQTQGPFGAQGLSAYEVAVKNGYTGTEQEWLASLKGERGDGQSSFKSIIFCRMNGMPTKPTSGQGSWLDPSPHVSAGTNSEGTLVYWEDAIPAGTNKIWACSRIFTIDGNPPQEAEWSNPRQMTDVEGVFDVEFAKMQSNDAKPPLPTDANRHGGSGPQVWFDPVLDSTEDFTTMFWRAERSYSNGVSGDWVIERLKGEKGEQGNPGEPGATGDKTATVMLYKRAATIPDKPSADSNWPSGASGNVVYWFEDGSVTGIPVATGWSTFDDIPAGNDPIWAIAATAYAAATSAYDTIGRNEWSDPVELGGTGADGLSAMSIVLYKRSADAPVAFNKATTFSWDTNILSDGTNNLTPNSGSIDGWSRFAPAVGNPALPLWQISASALSSSRVDSIAANEWSTPARIGGDDGERTAVVYLYQRAATTPAKPNADSTFSFATYTLTDDIGNWKRQIPEGSNPLYIVAASAHCKASETTDTIAANEWSDPVKFAENGDAGLNSATVFLFQRASSQPSAPNAAMTYNFSNGVINCGGTNYNPTSTTSFAGGWSRVVPSGSQQCWVVQATAIATGSTDTIGTSEWSTPAQYVKDGAPGEPGSPGAQGPKGIAYRTSVWGAGINYKNDSANTSASVRIIDVATNKEVAFIDDPDFAAFQCKVSHTSHATNAPLPAKGQSNTWWEPYSLSDPLVTPLLLANTIDAKYIKADELIAGAVRTGNANVGTEITEGVFNIKQNGVIRARFGLSGNDLVLQFLDATGQNVLYEFGPTGINSYVQNTAPGYVQVSLIPMPAAAVCPDNSDGQSWTLTSPTTYYMFQDGVVKVGNNTTYYVQNQSEGLTSHSPYHGKLFTSNPSNPANASLISDGTYIQNVLISSSPIISGTSNKKIVYDRSTGPLINTSGWQSLGWYWHQANKVSYSGGVPGTQVSFLFRRIEGTSEIGRGPNVVYSVSVITRVNNMANIESEAQDYRH